ncbi:pyruvate dehydrogenase (lipoamide) kinase [Angomonas deanei]|uniref:Protein-serine/threonine kinase n=1 Tax=Angomonas deanei TaxID=59799 RepID=A0A7G2CJF0_9TRYP|nr:pyruvate dehydrogenase (lipoamide) kinase [Angomonas deanei]CAD2219988.1 Mitochondrial branched-chain alpha-ketoacid dehydrogenase kinase, putative [Angomonas deanei]|eukprot:EPY22271.1 pyruvate dehydrogenase (lipoamide) kinase [Angomonas deanei]
MQPHGRRPFLNGRWAWRAAEAFPAGPAGDQQNAKPPTNEDETTKEKKERPRTGTRSRYSLTCPPSLSFCFKRETKSSLEILSSKKRKKKMIRLSARLFSLSFRDLSDRLDSFEREVIELKSFRKAVENASPEVAEAAKRVVEEQLQDHVNNGRDLENPLTAKEFTDLNQFYAAQKNKTLELENLLYISKPNDLLAHAKTVHREYLVRIAKRARALNFAPYGLSQMPSILELKKYYQWSFHDMRSNPPPKTTEDLMAFDSLVRKVFLRHYNVSDLLCAGMKELSNREQWSSHQERLYVDYPLLEPFF